MHQPKDTIDVRQTCNSSAVAQKRRYAKCALVCMHLWPRSIQPHAKIIVVCFR